MIPNILNKGDTIGIIAPASGSDAEAFNTYIANMKNLGFNIIEGKNMRNSDFYLSASDLERAHDFNEMFRNKDVKAIICFRGGYGSMRMIDHIDLSLIKRNPKFFCGYSDITLLLNYINAKTNLVTFHGPVVKSNFCDSLTRESLIETLTTPLKDKIIDFSTFPEVMSFNEDIVNSPIVGGNLSIICSSLCTPYEIDTHKKILLIEEVNEAPYSIDRMLTQLKCAKKLNSCSGFLIGHLTPKNPELLQVVLSILLPLNKPILVGLPIGHSYPNLTIPIGLKCTVDFHCKKIIF